LKEQYTCSDLFLGFKFWETWWSTAFNGIIYRAGLFSVCKTCINSEQVSSFRNVYGSLKSTLNHGDNQVSQLRHSFLKRKTNSYFETYLLKDLAAANGIL